MSETAEHDTAIGPAEAASLFACLDTYDRVVLAVSSGSDSMAMLYLAERSGCVAPDRALVATVDHGLRAESAEEATFVAEVAARLGYEHITLPWLGDKPATGIQDAARTARYGLLVAEIERRWPKARTAIAVAHTQDDQAETVLMRLARGSGVDGLAGMAPVRRLQSRSDVFLVRPLLDIAKDRLTTTLVAAGERWREDPSNAQIRFERVRWRQARAALENLGITAPALALVAARARTARDALEAAAERASTAIVRDHHDGACAELDLSLLLAEPRAVRERVLMEVVSAMGGRSEPPRLSRIEALARRIEATRNGKWSIGGALVAAEAGDCLRVWREPDRAPLPVVALDHGRTVIWDGRYVITLTSEACAGLTAMAVGGLRAASTEDAGEIDTALATVPHSARAAVPVVVDEMRRPVAVSSRMLRPEFDRQLTIRPLLWRWQQIELAQVDPNGATR